MPTQIASPSDAALIATDPHGQIVRFSRAAEQLFGYSGAELCGLPLRTLFPQIEPAPHTAEPPALARRQLRGVRKDGVALVASAEITHIPVAGGGILIVLLHPPRPHGDEQAQLLLQARRLEILSEASRAFAEPGLRYEDLVERIVCHVAEQLACVCALHQPSDDARWLWPVALCDLDPEALAAIHQLPTIACEGSHPLAQVFRSGQPLLVPAVDPERLRRLLPPEYGPALERFPVRSLVFVPVQSQGQCVGVLSLIRRQSREPVFTQQDLRLAQDLADRAGLAIANARLFAQVQRELAERERAEQALEAERAFLARRIAERTADLSLANAELARAARLKDEFLANMSHELRTPLNAVLGRSQALQEALYGPVTPEQVRALHGIEESGQHLLSLINEILDLSKIETGKLELERTSVDVELLCAMCLRMVKEAAIAKRLTLTSSLDSRIETIEADERRLRQILVNLLSNAVKFTPGGGEVGLEVAGDPEQGTVTFTVWDTGIGIAAEDLPRLFQPFVQIDSSLSRQYTGTGLGLALVLRLAEAHGGSVAAESAPGRGSRFSVTLPWRWEEQSAGHLLGAALVSSPLPRVRQALVIEDSATAAAQVSRYLCELGVQAEVHSTATGAVERALAVWPDVVLLDVLLPDGDGWELLRALKAEPRTRAIPVLVVSVVDEPARARDLGAAGLLLKPLSRAALTQTLRQLFTLGEKPPAQELPAGAPGRRRPQILLAEDSEANIATLSDYLAAKGYDVAVARNGSEAVARAQEKRPELILMDIQMPGMDGLEAARRIRARADLAHIPIIALTALAMPGDRERCLEAGASDYLTKPVNLRTLLAAIAQCCPALRDDGCAG